MEQVITPIVDFAVRGLWGGIVENVRTIKNLKSNVKALNEAMDQLNCIKLDVETKVQLAQESQMVRTKMVDNWMQRIESLEKEVNNVSEKAEEELQRSCWSCCPNSCWSRRNLGKEVKEKLKTIDDLKNQGNFDVVADLVPRGPVDERPLEANIGLNWTLEKVRGWIMDSQVKKIGIYGMGGVGKTTLLTKINNDLANINYGFDLVIWVVVSKESNVGKIQDAICERLKLSKDVSEDQKSVEIFRALQKKKFVILLDDLWKRLDLTKVGIPISNDQMYKIVFTTRSHEVCDQMGAGRKIEVGCLAREQALELFKNNVGLNTLNAHPTIPNLAEIIAEECKGLPLALVVVGRAMAGKCDPRDWDRALIKLRKTPSKIMDMDEKVFKTLKLSYDNLRDDILKSCFTYCCIYPEDHEIWIKDLLNLWIGEGYLDEFDDMHEARDQGMEIVKDLMAASLLEKGQHERCVKMHDVIREMALWILRGCSQGKVKKYMVIDSVELLEGQTSTSWTTAEKLSFWGGRRFSGTLDIHSCPNVSTFIVRDTKIQMFPYELVQFMHGLKVLDLSWNSHLKTLPSSIDRLVELEFLNLSNTTDIKLPIELKKLVKMKYLLMGETKVIPRKLISSFSLLRMFRLSSTISVNNDDEYNKEDNILSGGGSELLEELESLEHLTDISINVKSDAASVDKLQHSSKLQNCLSFLGIWKSDDETSVELFLKGLRNLECLVIHSWEKLTINFEFSDGLCLPSTYFSRLRQVYILKCKSLLHLTWFAYAPALEELHVRDCESMVEIVNVRVEADCGVFSRLKILYLSSMPSLQSIYPESLPFLSLVEMSVYSCPHLKRLPFDSSSANGTLKKINAEREWWDQLQWDDQICNRLFHPFLDECP